MAARSNSCHDELFPVRLLRFMTLLSAEMDLPSHTISDPPCRFSCTWVFFFLNIFEDSYKSLTFSMSASICADFP